MKKPAGLSKESGSIWNDVHVEWKLTKLEETYLGQAVRENDKALKCEKQAEEEGLTLTDANGRHYLNPLLTQAKIARNNYLRLMKLIGFERVLREKAKKRGPGRPTESEQRQRGDEDAS